MEMDYAVVVSSNYVLRQQDVLRDFRGNDPR